MRRSQLRRFKAKLQRLRSLIREEVFSEKNQICFSVCKLHFIASIERELLSSVAEFYLGEKNLTNREQKDHILQRAYLIILENKTNDGGEILEEIFHEEKLCKQYIHCDDEMKSICNKIQ